MVTKCMKCKNARTMIGAYTGTHYVECELEREFAENATSDELDKAIKENISMCNYCAGTPIFEGLTFDD